MYVDRTFSRSFLFSELVRRVFFPPRIDTYRDFVDYILLPSPNWSEKENLLMKLKVTYREPFIFTSQTNFLPPAYVSNTTTNKSANILDPVSPSCICHAMYHPQSYAKVFFCLLSPWKIESLFIIHAFSFLFYILHHFVLKQPTFHSLGG